MRPFISLCLLCLLVSCSGPKTELLPVKLSADSIIPRDEMIRILMDVQLVEAAMNLQKNKGENISHLTGNYYQWLFKKYHLSEQRFRDNLKYYRSDPENFSKMYEEVLKNLTDKASKTQNAVKK